MPSDIMIPFVACNNGGGGARLEFESKNIDDSICALQLWPIKNSLLKL
jgi:hypothetical protein